MSLATFELHLNVYCTLLKSEKLHSAIQQISVQWVNGGGANGCLSSEWKPNGCFRAPVRLEKGRKSWELWRWERGRWKFKEDATRERSRVCDWDILECRCLFKLCWLLVISRAKSCTPPNIWCSTHIFLNLKKCICSICTLVHYTGEKGAGGSCDKLYSFFNSTAPAVLLLAPLLLAPLL